MSQLLNVMQGANCVFLSISSAFPEKKKKEHFFHKTGGDDHDDDDDA